MMLAGRTALVTGSTSGIGLGIAKSLAQQGANIVLNGFGNAEEALDEVRQFAPATGYHGADMSKHAEIEDMIRYAEKMFGSVDILVNNAGIQHLSPVESYPVEVWDRTLAINLSAAFHTTRLALPGMKVGVNRSLR